MAIYHLSAKIVGRGQGRSVVAAAAYRSGERLVDERQGRTHDFSGKQDIVHAEMLLPDGTPRRFADRATLWNEVEAGERRRDAQLAREIELALPRELALGEAVALARQFVADQFVSRGMIADLCVHAPGDAHGEPQPHAHVLLTMREISAEGFGAKVRDWNRRAELLGWREAWAERANERLAELGHDRRVDHRSLADQGLALEPQTKIGPAASRREVSERTAEHRAIARRNGERIAADPDLALRAITHHQSTFTRADLARFVHRHSDGAEQFQAVMGTVEGSPELVRLGKDARGADRFTTRDMVGVEASLVRSAALLAASRGHGAEMPRAFGAPLSDEQQAALGEVLRSEGLSLVVGVAGSGKSAMLATAREAWEQAGYRVRGLTLSAIAAQGLTRSSGIKSRTIASLEHAWARGYEELSTRDVLVIDEAGLVGSRQMARVLGAAASAGAKVVAVGDAQQLQAIEAGAPFRALVERHGAAELVAVWRQSEGWQREATTELAAGQIGAALQRYADAGMVRAHDTVDVARSVLVDRWLAGRDAGSAIMLAATRNDAAALNALARERRRGAGELGADVTVTTARGPRVFAAGDTVMFLRNAAELDVRNGTLGRIDRVSPSGLIAIVEGRQVEVAFGNYAHVDHGYAATIHKAQGLTVDRAFVLASPAMDRHSAYVALSRHRDAVELHYGREDFASAAQLARRLSRERLKDMALDHAAAFGAERGLEDAPKAGRFERLRLAAQAPALTPGGQSPRAYERLGEELRRLRLEPEQSREDGRPERPAHAIGLVRGLTGQAPRGAEREDRDQDRGFEMEM